MGLGVGLQSLMVSSKCKQNMHKHTQIMLRSTYNPTSKTETFFIENYKTSHF